MDVTRDIVTFIDSDLEYAMSKRSKHLVRIDALIPIEVEQEDDDVGRAVDRQDDSSYAEDQEEDFLHQTLLISREFASQRESELVAQWLTTQLSLGPPPADRDESSFVLFLTLGRAANVDRFTKVG